jgi:RNA polymerase sigma-70 factor (ECF subfamily)
MGSLRCALPWDAAIAPWRQREQGRCVEPDENPVRASHTTEALHAEDAAMAARCRSGDLQGYERLYALQGARMKNLARNMLGNPMDAEDAVQETFLKIQRSIASFRGQSSFVTWAYRILVNTCYDARRRRVRKKEIANEDEGEFPPREPHAAAAHPTLKMALERALAQLPGRQRDVFLLYEVEGFPHGEIASILKISAGASKNTLFQAKKQLRQVLEAPRSVASGTW